MHTHKSIMLNAMACERVWGAAAGENVTLAVIPMFHITGMVSRNALQHLRGATMVLMPRWDRELAGRLISQYKVTNWTNIPTMVIDLFASPNFQQFDLSSLTYIGGGGAAMPQAVAQRLYEAYGLRYQEGYGLTGNRRPFAQQPPRKCQAAVFGHSLHQHRRARGGPRYAARDARGRAGRNRGQWPPGVQRLLAQRGRHPRGVCGAGWQALFRTGDLGAWMKMAILFITDRLKRMINASGFKVWPAEVEALMFRHPAIQEACIISAKDAYRGETVKAVVALREAYKGQVSAEDIMAWCRENMAAYKVPRLVSFADASPKSGSGKVMWRLLQEAEATPGLSAAHTAPHAQRGVAQPVGAGCIPALAVPRCSTTFDAPLLGVS